MSDQIAVVVTHDLLRCDICSFALAEGQEGADCPHCARFPGTTSGTLDAETVETEILVDTANLEPVQADPAFVRIPD